MIRLKSLTLCLFCLVPFCSVEATDPPFADDCKPTKLVPKWNWGGRGPKGHTGKTGKKGKKGKKGIEGSKAFVVLSGPKERLEQQARQEILDLKLPAQQASREVQELLVQQVILDLQVLLDLQEQTEHQYRHLEALTS